VVIDQPLAPSPRDRKAPSTAESGSAATRAVLASRILGAAAIVSVFAVTAFLAALANMVAVRNPLPAIRRLLVGLAAIAGLVVVVGVVSVFFLSRQDAEMCGSPARAEASAHGPLHPSAAAQPTLLTLDVAQPIQRLLPPLQRGAEQATPRTDAPTPSAGDQIASADMSGEIPDRNGWTMVWEVSADDGLVLRDVRLNGRCMAASISVPYLTLTTTAVNRHRLELMRESDDQLPYVSHIMRAPDITWLKNHEDSLVIAASYTISEFSTNAASRLEVDLTYQFDAAKTKDCEPLRLFLCAKFYPMVHYDFRGGNNESLMRIAVAQRLHFEVDSQKQGTYAGLFQDRDSLLRDDPYSILSGKQEVDSIPDLVAAACTVEEPTSDTENDRCVQLASPKKRDHSMRALARRIFNKVVEPIAKAAKPIAPTITFSDFVNPVPTERYGNALHAGNHRTKAGVWDNVHFVSGSHAVTGHRIDAPGCPPCVHIHWRWSRETAFLNPKFFWEEQRGNKGKPIVPKHSVQRVEVALAKAKDGNASYEQSGETWYENDPRDFRDTVLTPEPLTGTVVLWYEGSSNQQSNTFFHHGGFFAPDPGASIEN
jgi:hypothetical protein